jgi:hypothetical protein
MRYFAEVENVDEQWPSWPNGYQPGNDQPGPYLSMENATLTPPPWPTSADPVNATYSPEYVLWAAQTPDARIWVPTARQVREAYSQAHAAVQKREREAEKRAGRRDTPTDPRREHVYIQPTE